MAVTHSTAARDAATDAVTALIGASGSLVFRLSGTVGSPGTAVATLPLSATAFASSSSGTATANAITSDTNATGNASPVATATLQTSTETCRWILPTSPCSPFTGVNNSICWQKT